jgi:hypothetical protein
VKPFERPGPEAIARIRAIADPTMTAEEVRAALAVPLGLEEEQDARALIRWFRRRYPTPAERLAYVRRAYRRWTLAHPRLSQDRQSFRNE